ncbi:MAG: hypothetical protein WCD60_12230, partial [Pseudolabrys sp.]
SCPLSQKPVQKRFAPEKRVAFLWKTFFAKKFSGAGKDSAVGACVRLQSHACGRGVLLLGAVSITVA